MIKIVTVSHLVKKIIKDKPFLQEALAEKIISYGNLAEQIIEKIQEELEKPVKHSAVVMALRRYADEIKEERSKIKPFDYSSEISMKTNLCDVGVQKKASLIPKIKSLYSIVDFDKGDTLNIILGNYEVSIVINEKYKQKVVNALKGEKIIHKESNLVALTMRFSDDFINTPGVIFTIIRKLAWENTNIYEVVSTLTELTLILKEKDSMKAYEALQSLMKK